MTKGIGFILTITGLLLLVTFVQVALPQGPIPLPYFVILAVAVMMLSVGVRYLMRGFEKKKPKTPKTEPTPQQDSPP
jgi:membrane protein implicated in regulation of membrane protease activity